MLTNILKAFYPIFYFIVLTVVILVIGCALIPSYLLYDLINQNIINYIEYKMIIWCMSIPVFYFLYGFSIMLISPLFNKILFLNKFLKSFKGNTFSTITMAWYLHNALIYIVRYTFLEFVTPSPFNIMFYRMMGMKIGKNVILNTTNISDACLIEIGNNVVIGGSSHLIAHYAYRGNLTIAPIVIGNNCDIGLKATVFGNNKIGDNSILSAHSVLLPGKNTDGKRLILRK